MLTTRAAAVTDRLDRLWVAPLVSLIAAVGIVFARLAKAAHGNLSLFIMAERPFADPTRVLPGITVLPNNGYDGQFFYRLALDPVNMASTAYGITFDNGFRLQRIGYPVLAFLLAAGQHRLVPLALVIVNVVAITVLGLLGSVAARDCGRHALWGLLIAGYFGFVFGLARDLAEPSAACFLLAGYLALRRRRWVLAGVLLAAGALTRETVLVVAGAFALTRLWAWLHRTDRPGRVDAVWVVPVAAFCAWQATVWAVTGILPIHQDGSSNSTTPLVALIDALRRNLHHLDSQATDWWWLEVLLLGALTVVALWSIRRSSAPPWERVALVAYTAEALSLSAAIWYGLADLRALDDLWVTAVLVLFASRRRLWPLAVGLCVVWPIVALHRTLSL